MFGDKGHLIFTLTYYFSLYDSWFVDLAFESLKYYFLSKLDSSIDDLTFESLGTLIWWYGAHGVAFIMKTSSQNIVALVESMTSIFYEA